MNKAIIPVSSVGVRKDLELEFKFPKIQYNDVNIRTKSMKDIENTKYKKVKTFLEYLKN